jgi:FkbM family methyltransferase
LDTAAVMHNLDLVISVDTATAHLAGALAVPVWTLLRWHPEWRWLLDRADSPWYPTMRLFRQPEPGHWKAVFQQLAQELSRLAAGRQPGSEPARAFNRWKPCRYGTMMYNIHDAYIGRSLDLYGEFSEGEADLFRRIVRPGMVVVEVGANIGAHTVLLAQLVGPSGRVWAFEPQRIVFQTLCANVALNSLTNVDCRHAAVGEEPGEIVVPLIDYRRDNNFGGLSLGDYREGERVPVVTLDRFDLRQCHLLKIDVEGMEQDVLAGARATIARCRPLLYVENDRLDKSSALIRMIDALGYDLYWHEPPYFNPGNFAGNRENVFGGLISTNMLCCPREGGFQPEGLRRVDVPPG